VPREELAAYSAGADVGVIPYEPVGLNNTYTTPNKLFEYLSVGLPIVCSHLPELVRVVHGREVGLTFARVEPELIAAALNRVLGDDELRARMVANALLARGDYTWARQAELLLALYGDVPAAARGLTPVG
jgi:glycosyltransferase involved in cell wall biosynthesis